MKKRFEEAFPELVPIFKSYLDEKISRDAVKQKFVSCINKEDSQIKDRIAKGMFYDINMIRNELAKAGNDSHFMMAHISYK